MQLSTFNHAPEQELHQLLKQLVHIDAWAHSLQQQRPFQSKADVLQTAADLADIWTWDDIEAALATHPRIGEKRAKAALSAKEQNFSHNEQAAISQDATTQTALFEGNVAYEEKFNFIFLIRAAGRSSDDILTLLQQRLNNDLDTEKKIVHQQLKEIALLRLDQEIDA